MSAIMSKEVIRKISTVFQISENIITDIQKSDDDLYTGLAKYLNCDRNLIKYRMHSIMYGVGARGFGKSLTRSRKVVYDALRP